MIGLIPVRCIILGTGNVVSVLELINTFEQTTGVNIQ